MITIHQYVNKYPIIRTSKKLILGTIHPHDHHNFKLPFFYGNKLSIWSILNEAFPGEIGDPISLPGILSFLELNKVSVSDTVLKCRRKNPTALDKDLIPIELNHDLVEQVRNSEIEEILFTSGFQTNNAFKIFYCDILKLMITPAIRANRGTIIESSVFGRPVKLTILYSPSGSSNVPLSTSKIYLDSMHKYIGSKKPVYDFKVDYYRSRFSN